MVCNMPRCLIAALALLALTTAASAQLVRSGTGATVADITGVRDVFRVDLGGGTVAGANGDFGGVRREINWDGVPDGFSAPNNLPLNFFNVNSPRGAVFATPGTGVQVSANAGNPTSTPVQFGNLDPSYPGVFEPFSPQKLFTAIGSNIVDVTFFLPGTATAALTRGFGAIFSDVDLANTTSIELFDGSNASLGTFFVPNFLTAAGGPTDESFSFLGISYANPTIARVRITNGNVAPGAGVLDQNGNANDVVVMDDFVYATPQAVPEPGALALALPLMVPAFWLVRRRLRS